MEFYAGKGNLSRCMRASGIRTASLDLLYQVRGSKNHKSNCMDILSPSGFWNLGSIKKGTFMNRSYIVTTVVNNHFAIPVSCGQPGLFMIVYMCDTD